MVKRNESEMDRTRPGYYHWSGMKGNREKMEMWKRLKNEESLSSAEKNGFDSTNKVNSESNERLW